MVKLCVVRLIQIMLFLENHVNGSNMIVGKIIFNIEVGLGFGHDLGHMYLKLKLIGQGLLPLRRRQILTG